MERGANSAAAETDLMKWQTAGIMWKNLCPRKIWEGGGLSKRGKGTATEKEAAMGFKWKEFSGDYFYLAIREVGNPRKNLNLDF